MLAHVIDTKLLESFKQYIETSNDIVVTCHISPDGDAVGSNLALKLMLEQLGKTVHVVSPDNIPDDMAFLPVCQDIVAFTKEPDKASALIGKADLLCCLDFNGLKRVGSMASVLGAAQGKKIMIDHHLYPEPFCNVTISSSEMTSTCELLYRVFYEAGWLDLINKDIAECIYTGMMTDTGNFSYNSNKPDLYRIVADLVERGIDKDRIYKLTLGTSSESRMRLNCYAIAEKMRVFPRHRAALTILDRNDLKKFHYQVGDTETLANMPLAIPNVRWSTFFREEKGYIKVSMRSEGDFPVNTLCAKYFNGGGHANAAGGEFRGSLEEAIETFKKILYHSSDYQNQNEDN